MNKLCNFFKNLFKKARPLLYGILAIVMLLCVLCDISVGAIYLINLFITIFIPSFIQEGWLTTGLYGLSLIIFALLSIGGIIFITDCIFTFVKFIKNTWEER